MLAEALPPDGAVGAAMLILPVLGASFGASPLVWALALVGAIVVAAMVILMLAVRGTWLL